MSGPGTGLGAEASLALGDSQCKRGDICEPRQPKFPVEVCAHWMGKVPPEVTPGQGLGSFQVGQGEEREGPPQ